MGREVRRVPAGWEHPRNERGFFIPLCDGFGERVKEWDEGSAAWERGESPSPALDPACPDTTYEDWDGPRPREEEYMPDWPDEERTHFMMYENVTEGTPISPAFATPEELARWLADSQASAFAGRGARYEQWLRVARGGYAPSCVLSPAGLQSGVEALGSEAPCSDG